MVLFGASSMLCTYYPPSALTALKRRYPGVRIKLIEAGTPSLQQMLLDG